MKRIASILAALLAWCLPAFAQSPPAEPLRIPLWEKGAPGFEDRAAIPEISNEYWTRNINNPSITYYPARAERVAAIEKPATEDSGEDIYNYGYRLWEAKLYPEAETQFKALVKNNPQHRRVSRAQNMLGRSLLDEGKPNLAVLAFYDNYRANPKGDRAHESLYYLAQALTVLKKPSSEICKVYDELTDVYPDKLSEAMKAGVTKGRTAQKCGK